MIRVVFLGACALVAALASSGCASMETAADTTSPGYTMAQTLQLKKAACADVRYLLFLPKDYANNSATKWPLMLFLHGSGERGTDMRKVATHGPPKIVKEDPAFPFILVAPQCPKGKIWQSEPLIALMDEIIAKYSVDQRRVYVTGLSMGGYGTWELGTTYPERFAAIAPICGGGELLSVLLSKSEKPAALKRLGIWAFHGTKDPVVPVEESKRMVEAVKQAGLTDVKLTIYPDAEHDSWTETYKNPELYSWLLAHERNLNERALK